MKAITLRNIPPRLARVIRQQAAKERTSLNQTVIRLLERVVEPARVNDSAQEQSQAARRDLSFLANAWSMEEARAFDRSLSEQRRIDGEIWKK